MIVLEAINLWKLFRTTIALKDVNLKLDKGLHLLLGPNGSGKTTLLKIWCGLLKPTRGKVFVKEKYIPWKQRHIIMKFMGVLFEDNNIPWWISGRDYLEFIAREKNIKWSEVVELAHCLNITSYWSKSIRSYSSGMKKKIILLSALIGGNEILILDEPYTLLDEAAVKELNKIIIEKKTEYEAILISSHVFTGIEEYIDSLTVLLNGKIVFHGELPELRKTEEILYECKVENPLNLIDKLYREGIEEIEIRGNKVYFKSKQKPEWIKQYECKELIDVKKLYEEIISYERS